MASLNKVILIGNVGNDPEVKYFDGGSVVARVSLATNETYTNRNNERVEQTEWFRVEFWNEQAKTIEKYLKKGNQLYVEGRLRTETYTDKEGKERFSLGVRAQTFQFIGGNRPEDGGQFEATAPRQQQAAPAAPRPQAQAQPAPQAAPARQAAPKAAPAPAAFDSNGGDDDLPF
ncbi:single-stranded DNA-binding protein [Fibrivirga algicola]|uniref:Single-stranded DNA-binding protein n=1 Tax=Fibrivirga algicola TaxID=2950420 RepID=A0ABX0QQ70_9BACT|nr:single-stranded DNA-binding protein [Fibrivirga algicola]ARK11235.1 single-stranded DNA-binding protein [Fibrella sp. ES10-3-2-2]NID13102.1 single-stranded DNA-binding protein [Fibrivirga algicola]